MIFLILWDTKFNATVELYLVNSNQKLVFLKEFLLQISQITSKASCFLKLLKQGSKY